MCSHSGQRVTKMELSRAISSGDLPSAIQQARAEIVTVSSQESMISPQDSICVDIMDRTELIFNGGKKYGLPVLRLCTRLYRGL